jgi:c-di-GMP-related signal transduction protein
MEDKIRKHIFNYGLITILFLLEELEQNEEFEKCQQIVNAIKSLNEKHGWDLRTRLDQSVIDEFFDAHKNSLSQGKIAFANIPHYMNEVLRDINN